MNNKPKTKLLTISLLCCGRPDTTERCLKSLMPIREAIDSELQVVDTGCSLETRAIIEKYADEVFEFEWCNDFAKARNFQLDQANGKMFLFIDDDEFFLDCKYIIEFFNEPDCTSYNIGGYFQRNYLDFGGKEYQDVEVVRMCSVTPETYFVGKVHEYIEPAYGNAMFMDARAGHYGYVYTSEEENIKHAMRNIPLLMDMAEEDPDNFRWPYQLAQEYKSTHMYDKMLAVCEASYDKTLVSEDLEDIRYRGSFICGKAIGYLKLEREEDLINLYYEQKKNPTVLDLPLAAIDFYVATVFFERADNEKCLEACNHYLTIMDKIADDRSQMFIQGGLFSADTFDDTKVNMIYCFIMTIGLDNDDYGPLTRYYRKINWKAKVVRLNRGFITMLLQKAAEGNTKKEISAVLNKFFASNGFRDLIEYSIENLSENLSPEELSNIQKAFKDTQGQKEIKGFIDLRILEKEIAKTEYWDRYADLMAVLEDYSNKAYAWQSLHDSWLLDPDDKVSMDKTTMFAKGVEQFVENSDTDVTQCLKIIKDLMKLRPALTVTMKELSRLYVQHHNIEKAKEDDPEKFAEMYKLEEALLAQIAELDAAGKSDEAVATYQQLVNILQESFGVETLHE